MGQLRAMENAARNLDPVELHLAGAVLTPLCEGALWWSDQRVLVVSDLHLEKGSSYAARGQMLPPYDTDVTLGHVEALCRALLPATVISLGDSFHDRGAELRLSGRATARIQALTSACDWVWVEGNHDPDPPKHLGGRAARTLSIGPLVFRHEPEGEVGEVAGHLHPAAKVRGRGRSVRRRCFATDGDRLIMPALGAFTGGLNVRDAAFRSLFPDGLMAFALGTDRVYALTDKQLIGDDKRASAWRL
ncbi:MAG: ligase-associated DNA damage response endonuclease PdeM [Pseudomonadota bacterium]